MAGAQSGQGISNRFTFSSLPRTERGQPIVMDKDPKGETFLYCHGNSVIIRNLASPQMADIYTQHSCQVSDRSYQETDIRLLLLSGECGQVQPQWLLHSQR